MTMLNNRQLFLLHGSILETLQDSNIGSDQQRRAMSCLALDMVCKMTVDVLYLYEDGIGPVLPICSFYNLRAARMRLEERGEGMRGKAWEEDVKRLRRAEDGHRKMWGF